MTLWLQNVRFHRGIVDVIHTWYDSLQYSILFPNAEDGYSIYLRQVDHLTRLSLSTVCNELLRLQNNGQRYEF